MRPTLRRARMWTVLFAVLAALGMLGSPLHAQSGSGQLTTVINGTDTTTVAVLDSSAGEWLGVQDMLAALRMPGIVNDTTGKIEFLTGRYLIRLTDGNPFVVVTERSTNASSVYQMHRPALRRGGRFFAPAHEFLPLFGRLWGGTIDIAADGRLLTFASTAKPGFDITGVDVERRVNGYLLTLHASRKLDDVETWLKPDGWLFVTVANATADSATLQRFKPTGAIKRLLVFPSPTSVQLTFQVSTDVEQAETAPDPASNNLLISLRTRSELSPKELTARKNAENRKNLERERDRWKLDVIVIDAGHGGKDPGAIGVSGVREKDVTLAVALQLGKLIEQGMKGVKVVYTRKTDTFVELYRRTQIANEAGGKLFISLHCNSLDRKPSRPNGFEIYLLRPGRTEDAVSIAARENSVIQFEEGYQDRYKKLTEEEFIIVTMAQSAYVKYSEEFAALAARAMARQLNIRNSGVKQAGFYVLVGASMPNVLVEMGYLSNRKEERVLKSAAGQKKIAQALFNGVREYKAAYEKALRSAPPHK